MERKLRVSDPRLTVMFAIFTSLNRDESRDGGEALSRHRRRHSRLWPYALVLSVAMGLIGIGVAVTNPASPSCGLAGFTRPTSASSSAPATCPRQPAQHAAIPNLRGR
jgi:hypothetical protein